MGVPSVRRGWAVLAQVTSAYRVGGQSSGCHKGIAAINLYTKCFEGRGLDGINNDNIVGI
jgi:hypothetical protein